MLASLSLSLDRHTIEKTHDERRENRGMGLD
jgi:hypothetical protein